jgi:hypothetical protein
LQEECPPTAEMLTLGLSNPEVGLAVAAVSSSYWVVFDPMMTTLPEVVVPTASQTLVDGQDTATSDSTRVGSAWFDHTTPPSVVDPTVSRTDEAFVPSPTNTQSEVDEHDTEAGISSEFFAPLEPGTVCSVQVTPPSVVDTIPPGANPGELSKPTATQSAFDRQDTDVRSAIGLGLCGAACTVQALPPCLVTAMSAPPRSLAPPTATQLEVEAQEIPETTAPPGKSWVVHTTAESVETITEVPPVATQSAVEGQDTAKREVGPLGAVRLAQETPPSVVVMMAGPVFSAPTATQSEVDGQETPTRSARPAGTGRLAHDVPPLAVVRTAAPLRSLPTATQSEVEAHATASSADGSGGNGLTVQRLPLSVVVIVVGVELSMLVPTQADVDAHDNPTISCRPTGILCLAQVEPPSLDVMMEPPLELCPAATQSDLEAHLTVSRATEDGVVRAVQRAPPSVVVTTSFSKVPPSVDPATATQSVRETHDTPRNASDDETVPTLHEDPPVAL